MGAIEAGDSALQPRGRVRIDRGIDVIDQLAPGVGSLQGKVPAESLDQGSLPRIVDRVARRFVCGNRGESRVWTNGVGIDLAQSNRRTCEGLIDVARYQQVRTF